jgi:hypothetical protein
MRSLRLLACAAALALIPCGVVAEEKPRLEELQLGTWWYGARVDKDDLAGKVVLVELWGS